MTHPRWFGDGDADFPLARTVRGLLWRLSVSVLAPIAWLSFTLLFFGFWAAGMTLVQEVIVGIVSVLSLFGVLVVVWVSFGLRLAGRWVAG